MFPPDRLDVAAHLANGLTARDGLLPADSVTDVVEGIEFGVAGLALSPMFLVRVLGVVLGHAEPGLVDDVGPAPLVVVFRQVITGFGPTIVCGTVAAGAPMSLGSSVVPTRSPWVAGGMPFGRAEDQLPIGRVVLAVLIAALG